MIFWCLPDTMVDYSALFCARNMVAKSWTSSVVIVAEWDPRESKSSLKSTDFSKYSISDKPAVIQTLRYGNFKGYCRIFQLENVLFFIISLEYQFCTQFWLRFDVTTIFLLTMLWRQNDSWIQLDQLRPLGDPFRNIIL